MSENDLLLWRAWRERRDGRAFDQLVRPHLGFAAGFARRLGCGDADADDVVQRSLVSLATEARDKPARVGVRAWLGRSVLSESRMLFRARRRRGAHEARAVREASTAGPEGAVDARDEVEALLAGLDEASRRVVELRFLYDLDYREIAHVVGGSPLACRLRVHRAVSSLRRRLGSHATMLVAALPHGGAAGASVHAGRAIAAAAAAPAHGVATMVAGGIAMATAWKIGAAAAGVALAAWLGWTALRPATEETRSVARGEEAPEPAAGLAAAPPKAAAAPAMGANPAASPEAAAMAAPGDAPLVSPPLDAPIPAGKGSVAGTIRFSDGAPLRRTRVELWGSPAVTAETDDEGRFHIHGDWVGERELGIVGPHDYALELAGVHMKVDERVTVDVVIERGFALSARVVDAISLAPLAGALVTLRRPGSHTENVMQAGFGMVRTDEDGRFRLEYLPAAPYFLSVQAKGFQTLTREFEIKSAPEPLELRLAKALPMVVRFEEWPASAPATTVQWSIQGVNNEYGQHGKSPLGAEGDVRIDAPPPGSYHLLVFESGILPRFEQDFDVKEGVPTSVVVHVPAGSAASGTLRTPDGRPLGGVRLRIGDAQPVRTDAEGKFAFPRVGTGKQTAWIHYDDGEVKIASVDASMPPEPSSLELRTPGTAEITATLVGSPIVALYPAGGKDPRRDGSEMLAQARPDEKGRIRIPYLAAGSYRVFAYGRDADDVDRTVEVANGQVLDLGEVRLVAFPVMPVTVSVPPGAKRPTLVTAMPVDERGHPGGGLHFGRIEFDGEGRGWLKGLPAGDYRVVFAANGFAQSPPTAITVKESAPVPLAIELRSKP